MSYYQQDYDEDVVVQDDYAGRDYDDERVTEESYDEVDYDDNRYAERNDYTDNSYVQRDDYTDDTYVQRDDYTDNTYVQRDDYTDDRYVQRDGYTDDRYVQRNDYVSSDDYVQRDNYAASTYRTTTSGYDTRGFTDRSVQERGYQNAGSSRSIEGGGHSDRRKPDFSRAPPPGPPPGSMQSPRRKSLLVGINYIGSQHQLQGCHQDVDNVHEFVTAMGYPTDQRSQVIMRDDRFTDPKGPMFPNGHNLVAAMNWLVSEPNTINFLHYSGHGGQVPANDARSSGFADTIVPVDFERSGQIPSGVLHRILVTTLPPNSTLFVVFDCCHSGSAIELPYVYRSDEDGNVSVMDNVQAGMRLMGQASHLIQGGFSMEKVGEAKELFAGATSFFKGLSHEPTKTDEYGLGEQEFADSYRNEGMRNVWMYSGCRDDQTSADASIAGSHVGAMSWAFLESMKRFGTKQSYIQVLQNTRQILKGRYTQVPQLSVGFEQDLNYKIQI